MKRVIYGLAGLLAFTVAAGAQTDLSTVPDFGTITSSNLLMQVMRDTNQMSSEHYFQVQMDLAARQRHEKRSSDAARTLVGILESNAPAEFQRKALFDLALATQDIPDFVKAQQIYSQYLHLYPDDQSAPEVLLRQGLLYRQMGVASLAISKFYAVMSTALKLKLDNIDYYKKLVLQAQTEIADTYYTQGEFAESADFYSRLLKAENASLNKEIILPKLIRSLSYLTNHVDTISRAQTFLEQFTNSPDLPEVRFMLASAYKGVGRNQDALKQVLLLLQSQQENVQKNPELWAYWQRRAGNEIANQLYKEADFLNALQIYQSLADLDMTPSNGKAPVWYQTALDYEQLQQWQMATDTYSQIIDRATKDLNANNGPQALLGCIIDMAQWRKRLHRVAAKGRREPIARPLHPTPFTIRSKTSALK
jgi:tetratricopeptide (TPR) repeat protein